MIQNRVHDSKLIKFYPSHNFSSSESNHLCLTSDSGKSWILSSQDLEAGRTEKQSQWSVSQAALNHQGSHDGIALLRSVLDILTWIIYHQI